MVTEASKDPRVFKMPVTVYQSTSRYVSENLDLHRTSPKYGNTGVINHIYIYVCVYIYIHTQHMHKTE